MKSMMTSMQKAAGAPSMGSAIGCATLLSLAGILLFPAAALAADVYRWVDSQGRVQYSDQPPAGIDATKVTTTPSTGAAAPATVKTYQEQDQDLRKRRIEEEEKAKKEASAEQQSKSKQKSCRDAKAQLASLQNGGRFVKTNEKGEREYLDDKAIAAATADANKAVAEWCK